MSAVLRCLAHALSIPCVLLGAALLLSPSYSVAQSGPFSPDPNFRSTGYLERVRTGAGSQPQYTVDRLILFPSAAGLVQLGFINYFELREALAPIEDALNACQPGDTQCITSGQAAIQLTINHHQRVVSHTLVPGEELFIQATAPSSTIKIWKKDPQGSFSMLQQLTMHPQESTLFYNQNQLAFQPVSPGATLSQGGGYSAGIDTNLPGPPPIDPENPPWVQPPVCRVLVFGGGSFQSPFSSPQESNAYPFVKGAVDLFRHYHPDIRVAVSDVWYSHRASISSAANDAHQDIQSHFDRGEKLIFFDHCQGSLVGHKVLDNNGPTYYQNNRTVRVFSIDPPFTGWVSNPVAKALLIVGGIGFGWPSGFDIMGGSSVLTHMWSHRVQNEMLIFRKKLSGEPFHWKKPGAENDNFAFRWDHTPWIGPPRIENINFEIEMENKIILELETHCVPHYPSAPIPPAPHRGPTGTVYPTTPTTPGPGSCTPSAPGLCTPSICGDGFQNAVEECDDGNTAAGDGCSDTCQIEKCGDGTIQAGIGEECDDGNTLDEDGCSTECKREFCGDGVTQQRLGEECDFGSDNEFCKACKIQEPEEDDDDGHDEEPVLCQDLPGAECIPDAVCNLLPGPGPVAGSCAMYIIRCNSNCECPPLQPGTGGGECAGELQTAPAGLSSK